MAGRSWAEHFRGRGAAPKPGAPPPAQSPPVRPGGSGSIFELIGRWQVIVTLIAATTGVWFGLEDRDQKRLAINQEALKFVRDAAVTERFWADPPNTVNEIEASYPRHAFCATLGYLLAEISRADLRRNLPDADGPDRGATLNSARSAIDEEVTRIADQAGMPICYLRELARATAGKAVPMPSGSTGGGFGESSGWADPGEPEPPELCREVRPVASCAAIEARTQWIRRQVLPRECLLVLDAYGENACVVESAVRRALLLTEQKRDEALRLAGATRAPEPAPPDAADGGANGEASGEASGGESGGDGVAAPGPVTAPDVPDAPAPGASTPSGSAVPAAPIGPGRCGDVAPAVFTQYRSGSETAARAVAEALSAAGWSLTPLDSVNAVPRGGEVRYYYAEQKACAEGLAEDATRALRGAGVETPGVSVISLAGTYRNLPRGRVELWLPSSG